MHGSECKMSCFYFFPERDRKGPFYPSSLNLIPSSLAVFLYSRNPFAVAWKETAYFVLYVEKNVGICYYARSVNACPFQNKYHARYFPSQLLPCYRNFPYRITFLYKRMECLHCSIIFKLKPEILPNDGLLLLENSVYARV